jgi:hypothetical protein
MGGSAFGPQDAGPPFSLPASSGPLQSHARFRTIDPAHEGFRCPSDSERRQRSAARPLPFSEAKRRRDRLRCRGTAHSSSGLGRRPLTAVARVRIPYAPLNACLAGLLVSSVTTVARVRIRYAPLLHSVVTRSRRRSPTKGHAHAPSRPATPLGKVPFHGLAPLVELHDLVCYVLVHHRDGRIIPGGIPTQMSRIG